MNNEELLRKRHALVQQVQAVKQKYKGKRNCKERQDELIALALKKSDIRQALKHGKSNGTQKSVGKKQNSQ